MIFLIILQLFQLPNFIPNKKQADVIITQNGTEYPLKKEYTEITLKKDTFGIISRIREFEQYNEMGEIVFFNALITATETPEVWKQLEKGKDINQVFYYQFGTALAFAPNGLSGGDCLYDALYLNEEAHHAMAIYSRKAHEKNILKTFADLSFLYYWEVFQIFNHETREKIPIQEHTLKTLYFTIFIDKNMNNILDKKEFYKLQINFEE